MTVGKQSAQLGNAVPLQGESEMRQISSGIDLLTMTLASGATSTTAGRALVVKRWAQEGTSGGVELVRAQYDGLRYRRSVVNLSTASSAATLTEDQCGAFIVTGAISSGMTITLPAISQGLWYEIYVGALNASGAFKIAAASTGTMVVFNDAAADAITIGGSSTLQIGGSVRVIADASAWYVITQPAFSSVSPTSNAGMTHYEITT